MQILEEFYNIFGPDLKGVTDDPKRIDEVLCRVDSLLLPIEEAGFNPFNSHKMRSWKIIMQDFHTVVEVSFRHGGYVFAIVGLLIVKMKIFASILGN